MCASINKAKTLKSEKLAFFDWVLKWAQNNNSSSEEVNVDIPQIAAILQTVGFKLESMDQPARENSSNETLQMTIELKCEKSGTKAILSKRMDTCICPNPEKANEGIFWVFSGTGPSTSQDNLNRIDESHSNLIPTIPKEKSTMIKDVMTKVFNMISETDVNQNKQTTNYSDLGKPSLKKSDTWEVDPKTSPPIGTSSPLPDQLNSDKEHLLAEILHNVKENLEKALVLLPQNNNTFTKTNVKRVSNIKVSPTITTPTRATSGKSTPDLPKRSTPKKPLNDITPKTSLIGKRQLNVASKIGSFRKNTLPVATGKLTKAESLINLNKTPTSPLNLDLKKMPRPISKCSSLRGSNSNLSTSSPRIRTLKPTSCIPAPSKISTLSKSNVIASIKKF